MGRDPGEIERTAWFDRSRPLEVADRYVDAGATHVIYGLDEPFDLAPVEALLRRSAAG